MTAPDPIEREIAEALEAACDGNPTVMLACDAIERLAPKLRRALDETLTPLTSPEIRARHQRAFVAALREES